MYLNESSLNKIQNIEESLKGILGGGLALGAMTAMNPKLNPNGKQAFDHMVGGTKEFGGEMVNSAKTITGNILRDTKVGNKIHSFLKDATQPGKVFGSKEHFTDKLNDVHASIPGVLKDRTMDELHDMANFGA